MNWLLFVMTLFGILLPAHIGNTAERVSIFADSLEIRRMDGKAVYSGAVSVSYDGNVVTCDRLEIQFEEGALTNAESPAPTDAICTGNVSIRWDNFAVFAQRARWIANTGRIVIETDVRVERGKSHITADQIIYDLNASHAAISSLERRRVGTILFE